MTEMRNTLRRSAVRAVAIVSGAALLAGCQFGGLNSLNLPGTAGHGPGSYVVTVDVPDIATLPQNSPVMIDDVTVGSVSGIDAVQRPDGSFYAAVQLSLDGHVRMPANSRVKIAQTSLLGSQHVELSPPPAGVAPVGELRDGSHIELDADSRYPTTEEVLSSLGMVVNKGNLASLQDLTDEVYAAVAGRSMDFADLVPRLAELTRALDQQTDDIIAAAEGIDRFAALLADSTDSLGRTLDTLPGALRVLNENRANIVDTFAALQRFANVAAHVLAETKDDFAADMKDLYPVIKAVNDNRADFVTGLDLLPTFPFTTKFLRRAVRGDYLNVFTTFDLTLRRIGESIFTTSPFDPNMAHLHEVVNPPDWLIGQQANLSGQAADPFKIPPGTASGQEEPIS
ncbi:virulence factor Mce family protein [Mycolicibacterium thermoresistibile ATCC 19527]|uniref:Virulence factor Mce family protein n=3 Tax=Mycolicibacterium thermoresistibile TaxID=1797 RepID=G7CGT6_MYCT3|nr:virulence factor Mce family protein [Mycolicibacterium thermoresistibile ATCC 19527]GAT14940.1 MCE family lipoprotein LprN [Mycolicibacterium thermoresistibile]SNW20162.1 MCE-family lipoprotein LprN [Mycolicibacterium thermoresistibile]